MPRIAMIDDDYASEILVENLRNRGYDANRFNSASDAIESIEFVISVDLVILDMIMARAATV